MVLGDKTFRLDVFYPLIKSSNTQYDALRVDGTLAGGHLTWYMNLRVVSMGMALDVA
jgi:hypothetical protein